MSETLTSTILFVSRDKRDAHRGASFALAPVSSSIRTGSGRGFGGRVDAAFPVDERAEDVEGEGFDVEDCDLEV